MAVFAFGGSHEADFEYEKYQTDKLHGRILTPDGLRVVCAGLDNDPEKIGIHMLEMLAKFRNEGSHTAIKRRRGAFFYASMSIVTPDLKSMVRGPFMPMHSWLLFR